MVNYQILTYFILIFMIIIFTGVIALYMKGILYYHAFWRAKKKLFVILDGIRLNTYWVKDDKLDKNKKTYKADPEKGVLINRTKIHVFDRDNAMELDFHDKSKIFPTGKLNPEVYSNLILIAYAQGQAKAKMNQDFLKIGAIIAGVLLLGSLYLGYKNYEMLLELKGNIGTVIELVKSAKASINA